MVRGMEAHPHMNTAHDVLAFAEALQIHTTRMWAWAQGISVAVTIVDLDDGRIILEFARVVPGTESVSRVPALPAAGAVVDEMEAAAEVTVDEMEREPAAAEDDGIMYPWGVLRYDADGSVALLITHPDGWRVENAEATARAVSRFTFAWGVSLEVFVAPPVPPFFYRAAAQVLAQ